MCFKITHTHTQYTALLLSVRDQKLCQTYRWDCEEYLISFNECSCIDTENPDISNKFSPDLLIPFSFLLIFFPSFCLKICNSKKLQYLLSMLIFTCSISVH